VRGKRYAVGSAAASCRATYSALAVEGSLLLTPRESWSTTQPPSSTSLTKRLQRSYKNLTSATSSSEGRAFSCSRYTCRPTVFLGVGLECLLVVYGLLEVDFNSNTLRVAVLSDRWVELKLRWYSYLDSP